MKLIFALSLLLQATFSQEVFEFQSETSRLMEIIINSLYTQKEVFLRELISNAVDANDKIRFMAIKRPELIESHEELRVRVAFDTEAQTITIEDTGIGMNKQDLIQNLGTLAKSGTTQFLEQIKAGDMNLIGQFGVGFYSAFLVANKVEVYSRKFEEPGYRWVSSAADQYSIDEVEEDLPYGSRLVLHLKQEAAEYCNGQYLKELIEKFSQFVNFPIYLRLKLPKEKTVDLTEEEINEKIAKEEEKPEEERNLDFDRTKKVTEEEWDWSRINSNKAIWLRDKEEITEEEYQGFYKQLTNDYQEALAYTHFKGEGEVEFNSILFIPESVSWDLMGQNSQQTQNLKLYVRRVLIQDKFVDLVPKYLSFITGIIDSDDLPLNVSRETLQQSKIMKTIAKKLIKKFLDMCAELQKDQEKYKKFWQKYGKNLKYGLVEDEKNQAKLLKLVQFTTSKNQTAYTSLEEYVKRMPEKQEDIFFMGGENRKQILESPVIQNLVKQDYEVILMDEPIDEYAFQRITQFEGKKLVNVGKGEFKLPQDDSDRKRQKALKRAFAPLQEYITKLKPNDFQSVDISQRLVSDPMLVISTKNADSANMERVFAHQANRINVMPKLKQKILEINPDHPLVQKMLEMVGQEEQKEALDTLAHLMIDTALAASGYQIDNMQAFAKKIYGSLHQQLDLDPSEELKPFEVDLSAVEEEEADKSEDKHEEEDDLQVTLDDGASVDFEQEVNDFVENIDPKEFEVNEDNADL